MKVLDPGHAYKLSFLDGEAVDIEAHLIFVKREGDKFPGNVGSHPGTNMQEVLRALIDRVKYLDKQAPCYHNTLILSHFREALILLETRAAYRHDRDFPQQLREDVENYETCNRCGHMFCHQTC